MVERMCGLFFRAVFTDVSVIVRSLTYHVRRTRTDVLSSAKFRFYSWRVSQQYTFGRFNPFCVSFQSKKRKLKKSFKRKTPAAEGGEGEGETTTSDSKVSEGSLVHVACPSSGLLLSLFPISYSFYCSKELGHCRPLHVFCRETTHNSGRKNALLSMGVVNMARYWPIKTQKRTMNTQPSSWNKLDQYSKD